MDEDKLVTVKYYDSMVTAEVDLDVLKKNDIECTLNDSTVAGIFPIFDDKERGLEILVFENDLERAVQTLEDFHASATDIFTEDE